jgi:hypothetical protein
LLRCVIPTVPHEIGWQAGQKIKHHGGAEGDFAQHNVAALAKNFDLVNVEPKFLGQAHCLAVARLKNAGVSRAFAPLKMYLHQLNTSLTQNKVTHGFLALVVQGGVGKHDVVAQAFGVC